MPPRKQQQRPAPGKKRRPRRSAADDERTINHGPSSSPQAPSSLGPASHVLAGFTVFIALVAIVIKVMVRYQSYPRLPPIEPDPDIRIRTFFTWLQERGAKISPKVTLALFPDFGGYGVQAKHAPVHKYDELFTIPSSLIITPESVIKRYIMFKDEIDKITSTVFRLPSARQDFIIALHLMVECSLGESSDIWPYLQMLPEDVPRLDTFDDETLDMLQDEYLIDLARQSKSELSRAWTKGHLELITTTMAEVFARQRRHKHIYKGCLTFQSFHHYVALSSSRAMILEDGNKHLTPLADMMNHMPKYDASGEILSEPFVNFHTRNEDGSITVRADREVPNAGEQIFEAYGDTDNSLYLEAFGFVPDENPYHCAMIPPEHIPLYKDIEITFKRVGLSEMPDVCVYSDGAIASAEGRGLLALASANSVEGQVERCRDAVEFKGKEGIYEDCFNYTESDYIVGALTLTLVVQVYCGASTTIEEDGALLRQLQENQSEKNERKAVAVKFRMEEKKTLFKAGSLGAGDGPFTCEQFDEA